MGVVVVVVVVCSCCGCCCLLLMLLLVSSSSSLLVVLFSLSSSSPRFCIGAVLVAVVVVVIAFSSSWLSLEFEPPLVSVAVFELGREAKNLSRPGQQIFLFCWDNVCSLIGEEGRRGSEYTSVAVAGGAKESIRVRSIRVSPPGAAPRV